MAGGVLGAEPKPTHRYLLTVAEGDVGSHLGDFGVCGVHPEWDAERFPHLVDGADVVGVTVGGEDGADRPTCCGLEDRRRFGGCVDDHHGAGLGVARQVDPVVVRAERQPHQIPVRFVEEH